MKLFLYGLTDSPFSMDMERESAEVGLAVNDSESKQIRRAVRRVLD